MTPDGYVFDFQAADPDNATLLSTMMPTVLSWHLWGTNDSYEDGSTGSSNVVVDIGPKIPLRKVAFIGVAALVTIATILGNILVIVAVFTERRLRKVGNTFIVNLAVSDLLVGLVVTPVALVYHYHDRWRLGLVMCDIWISLDVICCTASIVNLCVISFDRYNAITRPLRYALKRTPKRAGLMTIFVWVYSLLLAVPPLFGWRESRPQSLDHCRVSQKMGYTIFSTAGAFYIPLAVMLVMYIKIFRATLKRKQKWVQPERSRRSDGKSRGHGEFTVLINATESIRRHYDNKKRRGRRNSSSAALRRESQSTPPRYMPKSHCSEPTLSPRQSIVSQISGISPSILRLQRPRSGSSQSGPSCRLSSISSVSTNGSLEPAYELTPAPKPAGAHLLDVPRPPGATGCKTDLLTNGSSAIMNRNDGYSSNCSDHSAAENTYVPPPADDVARPGPLRRRPRRNKISVSQEKRAARTLGIIMGGFVLCWLPFFILTLVTGLCEQCRTPPMVMDTFTWLGYFNSALNPAIYTFFNPDFKKAFKRILLCNRQVTR